MLNTLTATGASRPEERNGDHWVSRRLLIALRLFTVSASARDASTTAAPQQQFAAAGAAYDQGRLDEAIAGYRALVDLIGGLVFLLPLCAMTVWLSWGYVIDSWMVFEGSTEVGGLPLIFLYKTVIWVFAVLLGLQGVSMVFKARTRLK